MHLEDYDDHFQVRSDFVVRPLGDGSSKRQLLIPGQQEIELFAHLRAFPSVTNVVSTVEPTGSGASTAAEDAIPIVQTCVYGGVLHEHFGHFVAESVHRLWLLRLLVGQNAWVAFHVGVRRGVFRTRMPDYVVDVLSALGAPPERLLFIDRPMRFARIYFPKQGRYLGRPEIISGYSETFFGRHADNIGKRLYISRSTYLSKGSYFGERLVERTLAANGFEVIYPESLAPTRLVQAFREASEIVFAEGSAIHLLEICGRISARVLVVMRRSDKFLSIFEPVLSSVVSDYDFYKPSHIVDSLDWDTVVDRPQTNNAPCFVDVAALLKRILGSRAVVPKGDEIADAVRGDVLRYICAPESTAPQVPDEKLGLQLRKLRTTLAGVPRLLD